ncbi:hypothetical protein LO762_03810 [Actinocorallia sp. API 0066]|uniref:hypothetical protein n=1 Tax=Actinocorallia sp. API 0066 TaxID=2896846 RepID=UPI001E55875E|nr:hypothetical protein [Actinocorallia sp. API 0066]MCD0448325.1 hypothetical protein [Actinocorallia sp. API 0066]
MTPSISAQQAITAAERLLDPERVLTAVPSRPGASLQSLAGTALLHARLAATDRVFATAAHAHWTAAATHSPHGSLPHPGVFAAPGGLAASLILGERYLPDPEPQRRAVRQTVRWLSAQATAHATDYHERLHRDGAVTATWACTTPSPACPGPGESSWQPWRVATPTPKKDSSRP